jgi:hypothetical protein
MLLVKTRTTAKNLSQLHSFSIDKEYGKGRMTIAKAFSREIYQLKNLLVERDRAKTL